ncbi:MAG: HEAT repeat domain-containing protein [Deltaproteobacteria bacterium]|nr:HEAT repeat domain-containing protein [Deltaproteobacteria bacterium]
MYKSIRFIILAGLFFSLSMTFGCAPSQYKVNTPKPSLNQFADSTDDQLIAQIVDERREGDKKFHVGVLPSTLINEGKPIDPVEFLTRNIENELKARGVNISFATNSDSQDDVIVKLKKFRIRNHRASGFSPYFTFTTISADVETGDKSTRVTAYFSNGKVPVWSFDEVIDPCYNIPVNFAIKEFASKINRLTANYSITDSDVDAISIEIKNNYSELSYLEVYKLGFGNNKRAIPYLVELTKHENSLVRIAALASLGTIGAVDQFDYLKRIYNTSPWRQKSMALKSIGDFGTSEGVSFIKDAMRELQSNNDDPNDKYIIEVASLYL